MLATKHLKMLRKNDVSYGTLDALISERLYQERIWSKDTTASKGHHSDMEFIVFIDDYLREAIHVVSRKPEPMCSEFATQNIRKIAAMILASAEKNDWEDFLLEKSILNRVIVDNYVSSKNTVEVLAVLRGMVAKLFDIFGTFQEDESQVRETMSLMFMTCCFEMTNNTAISRELTNSVDQETKVDLIKSMEDMFWVKK